MANWTPEEDELIKCLIARGPAATGAWEALAAVIGKGPSTCRARGQHWRNALGLHVKGKGKKQPTKAKPAKARYVELPAPPPSPARRQFWPFWRKY